MENSIEIKEPYRAGTKIYCYYKKDHLLWRKQEDGQT